MSSIAYVTDEKMLEFHRLYRNRTIIFWRLSSKKKFSDFRKGDLLFFYSRPAAGKKKAFVGYAHYSSTKRLSLSQMWKYFGDMNGYPEDVGITLPVNLESYCYIDKDDPGITVRILQKAHEGGVDLWWADSGEKDADIFRKDEIRHQLAMIHHRMGKENGTVKEQQRAHKLALEQLEESGWETVRGSKSDCLRMTDSTIYVAIPFVYQSNDK